MRLKTMGLVLVGIGCLLVSGDFSMMRNVEVSRSWEEIPSESGVLSSDGREFSFSDPVDAMSIRMENDTMNLQVRSLEGSMWTEWENLFVETEFDPLLRESNLVMFKKPASRVQVRGNSSKYLVHVIRISKEPLRTEFAAGNFIALNAERVISRREWGADDELLFRDTELEPTERSDVGDNGNTSSSNGSENVSPRISECETAQKNHPAEFKVSETIRTKNGRTYRWPLSYSRDIKMLVVHHTALSVTGEARSGEERMRALYTYHSVNRGWGDVGYNFVIDEDGNVYEGKEGGNLVVAGHAYCNNVGTIGVALMGNFDIEEPTQKQMQSMKWLLSQLADTYDIDLNGNVTFHGKTYSSPVVGHGDLLSTDCPGYYVKGSMSQIRRQLVQNDLLAVVDFPDPPKPVTKKPVVARKPRVITKAVTGLSRAGDTSLTMNPGGRQRVSLLYTATSEGLRARSRLAQVKLSDPKLGLWLETGDGKPLELRTQLILLDRIKPDDTVSIPLLVQAPRDAGSYWIEIGGIRFDVTVSGRRTRDVTNARLPAARVTTGVTPTTRRPLPVTGSSSSSSVSSSRNRTVSSHTIRILLTTAVDPIVSFGTMSTQFIKNNNRCEAMINGVKQAQSVLRLDGDAIGPITLKSGTTSRSYRGIIECRIENGNLIIINELPLEGYLWGLSEEPDTEPYEKQRAFAIAARSYALYYLGNEQRKFPDKPYDGSDSPATFQAYAGIGFEQNNSNWVKAVKDTAGDVLTVNNKVIKVPYFSVSDGRTRSPSEAGWKNFPHAEIFSSKKDPWCAGMSLRGHGVGMSGCGSEAQANEGKSAEEILEYYYPGTAIQSL